MAYKNNIIQILKELYADTNLINKFLENYYTDNNNNNVYNLE